MSDLITKVKVKGPNSNGNPTWNTYDIGVRSENVFLTDDNGNPISNIKNYMKASSGGRNYLSDTIKEKILLNLEQGVNGEVQEGQLIYKGINEELYETVSNQTLEELGFKTNDFVTISFDWYVKNLQKQETKEYSSIDEKYGFNQIIWDETNLQESSAYLFLRDRNKNQLLDPIVLNFSFKDKQEEGNPVTKSIANNRLVLKTTNPDTWEQTSESKTLVLKEINDSDNKKVNHYQKSYLITQENNLLNLMSIDIQSPRITKFTTQPDNINYVIVKHIQGNFILVIKNFMLEKGIKSSDWSPAPQDIIETDSSSSILNPAILPLKTRTEFDQDNNIQGNTDYLSELKGSCYILDNMAFVDIKGTIGTAIEQKNIENQRFSDIFAYIPRPIQDISPLIAIHTKTVSGNSDKYAEKISLVCLNRAADSYSYTNSLTEDGKYYGAINISNPNAPLAIGDIVWIGGSYLVSDETAAYFGSKKSKEEDSADSTPVLNYYTVNFETNGGEGVASVENVPEGATIDLSTKQTTKTGYVFKGWKEENSVYTNSYRVTKNVTLEAYWIQEGSSEEPVSVSIDLLPKLEAKSVAPFKTLPTLPSYTFTRRDGKINKNSINNYVTIAPDFYKRDSSSIVTYYGAKNSSAIKNKISSVQGPVLQLNLEEDAFTDGTLIYNIVLRGSNGQSGKGSKGSCGVSEILLGSTAKSSWLAGLHLRSYDSGQTTATTKGIKNGSYVSLGLNSKSLTSNTVKTFKFEVNSVEKFIKIYDGTVLKSTLTYANQELGTIDKIAFRFGAYQFNDGYYQKSWKQIIQGLTLETSKVI